MEKTTSFIYSKGSAHIVNGLVPKENIVRFKSDNYKSRFFTQIKNTVFSISVSEIHYFIFEDNTTTLVTNEDRSYVIKYSLDSLERILNPRDFFRINRRCITHIDNIKRIHILSKSRIEVILQNNGKHLISRSKNSAFKVWLDY